ncbi:replication endonuclease [Comamonas antarctica]|uniref:Replication endonuclease n=1 Tax=Comamonas antarctica TaxID=2743470 RepID=A0A6N1X402_9BURK|nr:replication endonuclease [Comamonas antarctica]QKV52626.1 replication endonuclease [Comamonas antarctica]
MSRQLPTHSLQAWEKNKPRAWHVATALGALLKAVPAQWREPMQRMGLGQMGKEGPEWLTAHDALLAIEEFDENYGQAARWSMSDDDIRAMAKRLAAEADELDDQAIGQGLPLSERVDAIRLLVRLVGVHEEKPIIGEPAIKRAQDAAWWRRVLRTHVARVVEAGAVRLGIVNRRAGGYVSNAGLARRTAQLQRNAEGLKRTLYRNEAGQVFNLAELAALSPSNPVIRGGELMTRIRGAEEYADHRAHVGLFLTLTTPSRFHAVSVGKNGRGRPRLNPRYDGRSTPRDAQLWLRAMWVKVRAKLKRQGVNTYGIRVAEPHHDATPHWHALLWVETEQQAQQLDAAVREYWLSDDGDEPGAKANRVNIKRMVAGGAAGYVAKYIAKSVGHAALADHLDVVQGDLFDVSTGDVPGHVRVDAWASTWGIRQFQAVGMPSVTVWRELRRVGKDQVERLHFDGDKITSQAWHACHRTGDIKADWCRFMGAMGGHCVPRGRWHLRIARRDVPMGAVNAYGEEITEGRVVGLEARTGRWLVSRRIAWSPVAQESLAADVAAPAGAAALDTAAVPVLGAERAPLAPAWTRFNNCTARLTGELRRAFMGRGRHEKEDWSSPDSRDSVLYRPESTATTPVFSH